MMGFIFAFVFLVQVGWAGPRADLKVPAPHAYGMNLDYYGEPEQEFQKTAEAHFHWVRLWFNWREMQSVDASHIAWDEMDRQVQLANLHQLKIFASFQFIPWWANGSAKECQPWATFNCSRPATDKKYFYNFVRAVVDRYKNSIHFWGMGNEPNHGAFWNIRPGQTPEQSRQQYLDDVIENGALAVRASDPTAKTVGPDLSNLSKLQPNEWLRDVLTKKAQFIDVIAHHDYSRNADLVISRIAGDVRKVIVDSKNGNAEKPFWLTELGFDSKYGKQGQWQAESYTKVVQAAALYSWWRGTFLYRIADQKAGQSYGIVGPPEPQPGFPSDSTFVPWEERPAFTSLKALLNKLPWF